MKIKYALFFLVASSLTFSSQIQFSGTPTVFSVSGLNLKVYPQALVKQLNGNYVQTKLSGHGVRKTTVVFMQVNVYHAASYVMYPEQLHLANAMDGIKMSPSRIMYITALRPLTGEDVRTTIESALEFNDVDPNHPSMVKLMGEIGDLNVQPGDQFIFGATPGVSEQRIFFELPKKTFEDEYKNIADDFWKVWFAKPVDEGVKALKSCLVGPNFLSNSKFQSLPF